MIKRYFFKFAAVLTAVVALLASNSCKDDELPGWEIPGGYAYKVDSVTLNVSSYSIALDSSFQLEATIHADEGLEEEFRTVTWSTSDKSIATVDEDGEVSAVALGDVTITATYDYDDTIFAEAAITVVEEIIELESMEIVGSSVVDGAAIVAVADTIQLSVIYYPENATNKDIEWTQSHGEYAAVGKGTGMVTGKTFTPDGEPCVITAISLGNRDITASCDVTVRYIELESITVRDTLGGVASIGILDSLYLTYDKTPYNGTVASETWTSEDPNIATVDATGLVIGQGYGRTNITLECLNLYGTGDEKRVSATYEVVVEKTIASSISLSSVYKSLRPNDELESSVVLSTYPTYATADDLTWSIISDDGIVKTTDIVVTEVRDAYDKVTATLKSVSGKTGEFRLAASYTNNPEVGDTITLNIDDATNINILPQFHDGYFPITDEFIQLDWTYYNTGSGNGSYNSASNITWKVEKGGDIVSVDSDGKVTILGYELNPYTDYVGDVQISATSSYDGTVETVDFSIPAGYWQEKFDTSKSFGTANNINYGWNYYLFSHGIQSGNSSSSNYQNGYITITSTYDPGYEKYPDESNLNVYCDACRRSDIWCYDESLTLINGKTFPYLVFHIDNVVSQGLGNACYQEFGLAISGAGGTVANFTIYSFDGYSDSRVEVRYLSDDSMLLIYDFVAIGNSQAYTDRIESSTDYLTPTSISVNYFMYGYEEEQTNSDGEVTAEVMDDVVWNMYSVQTFKTTADIDAYIVECGLTEL